jgi:hypothetical protein
MRILFMKKLLLVLAFGATLAHADLLGTVAKAGNTGLCSQNCKGDDIVKVLGVTGDKVKQISGTACQVACSDQCFATAMNDKKTSADSAVECKDSLKKTFKL